MRNKMTGILGEFLVTSELAKQEILIALPIGDYAPYDILAIKDNKIKKIQVKTSSIGHIVIKQGENPRGYKRNEIDFFIIIDLQKFDYYIVPYDHIGERIKNLSFTKKLAIFKNNWSLLWE